MTIISHRGYWRDPAEKNTIVAFNRSFSLGFGTETDFRDCGGRLVIAHDLPKPDALDAETVFRLLARHDPRLPLAINIKADGLQGLLMPALARHGIENYFLFDMSVPDAVFSHKQGLKVFTRQSDVEPFPSFYAKAAGVWMDAFQDDSWLTPDAIRTHLLAGKQVCLVSPELHMRPHLAFWHGLREDSVHRDAGLILCTDLPEDASNYFQT